MGNLLARASEWLENQRTVHATAPVQYVRGSQTAEVSATIGKTTFELMTAMGSSCGPSPATSCCWPRTWFWAGRQTLPQRGDRVRETQGSTVFVYEVTAPGKEPCWRYSDAFRKTLRIHTKQVETENGP